ncbi:hypothetical protein ACFQ51_34835 [Streptomyces kaempferi]
MHRPRPHPRHPLECARGHRCEDQAVARQRGGDLILLDLRGIQPRLQPELAYQPRGLVGDGLAQPVEIPRPHPLPIGVDAVTEDLDRGLRLGKLRIGHRDTRGVDDLLRGSPGVDHG